MALLIRLFVQIDKDIVVYKSSDDDDIIKDVKIKKLLVKILAKAKINV